MAGAESVDGAMRPGPMRGVAIATILGLLAGALVTAWSAAHTTQTASAALGECPEGTIPGPGNSNPIWTDDNVAVYAGQDFRSEGAAAEAEGLMVVQGDADFSRVGGGTFNVGWVGVGSSVVPTPGEIMLAVGGDLSVGAGTVLDVGANARDELGELRGGNVDVGGVTDPDYETDGSRYRLNNGVLRQQIDAEATAPWSTWTADIAAESQSFAALAPTGTVTAGATLVFEGLTGADPQVFEVAASVLEANPALTFLNIPDDVPVIINVTGGPDVAWAPNYFADETGRVDDLASPQFGVVSAQTMWNFVDATAVHVGGSSQVLGSILVPNANPVAGEPSLRVTASTNGRLLTGGTIVMDGVGNEHHNYPWIQAPFDCIPGPIEPEATGSVTIAKEISPEDAALLPPSVVFHGIVQCVGPDDAEELVAEWFVAPGESVQVDDLPVGATCTISEAIGVGARLFAPRLDGAVFIPAQLAWQTPVWDPSPPVFTVPAATDPVQFAFTVTNALARGAFAIEKVVEGEGAPDAEFSGTWACTRGANAAGDGEWTLSAGESTEPIEAVVGSTCTVTETPPVDPGDGSWSAPVIAPASVLITVDSAQEPIGIVVTNTFTLNPVLGGFDIVKVVSDPDGIGFDDSFTGSWSCSLEGSEVAGGSWTAATGSPFAVDDIALGAECSVAENAPADPSGGVWEAAQISPASFVVTDAETRVAVTITNVLTGDEEPGGGGSLPATGSTVPWWVIAVGGGLVAAGAVVLIVTVARRGKG